MNKILLGTILSVAASASQDLFEREDRILASAADEDRTAANMHGEMMALLY